MSDPRGTVPESTRGTVDGRLLERLRAAADALEAPDAWPAEQFRWLAEDGLLRWNIPQEFGGDPRDPVEMTAACEELAAACLTTTFVLTQRNSACQRIVDSERERLKETLLPELARGRLFATVGISHLTTSRQHLREPAVRASRVGGEFELNGSVPWVTGAAFADYIVTGGSCDDGRQILVALPRLLEGVRVERSARLLALNASQTTSITLDKVRVPAELVLAGPLEAIINRGPSGGTGSLTTSALAVGLSRRALQHLEREAALRPDLRDVADGLQQELADLRTDLYAAAAGTAAESSRRSAASIRQRANSLVLRAAQAQLAASKGAGFVAGHPAERAVRESMFFLVWSCPQPVVAAALREFACLAE